MFRRSIRVLSESAKKFEVVPHSANTTEVATTQNSTFGFKAAKERVSGGSTIKSRISSFLAGAAIAGVFGYLRLREDVYATNNDIKDRVQATHTDVSVLLARIQSLENRLSNIEEGKIINSISQPSVTQDNHAQL